MSTASTVAAAFVDAVPRDSVARLATDLAKNAQTRAAFAALGAAATEPLWIALRPRLILGALVLLVVIVGIAWWMKQR